MFDIVAEHVFPFIRTMADAETAHGAHMKGARFTIPTPGLLQRVVDMLADIPMEDRDTKGDLYEYMLAKIASAGQNGRFRTPRHIISLMVEMTAPNVISNRGYSFKKLPSVDGRKTIFIDLLDFMLPNRI